jgi:hypothetical protein
MVDGFRTDPDGDAAAPPYTRGPYKFSQDISFNGNLRKSPGRYYLEEFFSRRPGLNADIDQVYTVEVARGCNQHFEAQGTNATTALVTFSATSAGIVMTTAGADNDQIIVTPHLDTTTNQTDSNTAWAGIQWGTENQVIWETVLTVGDDIATGLLLWAGLKLTNTPTVATDDDQVFFRFSTDDSDTNWEIVSSIGGTDSTTDSGVAVAANTQVRFRIAIDSDRIARFYINDVEILAAKTTALTNDVDFIPYVGIQALSGTAEFVTCHYMKISRILFE